MHGHQNIYEKSMVVYSVSEDRHLDSLQFMVCDITAELCYEYIVMGKLV
jgi:hypothetical protein